jgi:hypothetical protein
MSVPPDQTPQVVYLSMGAPHREYGGVVAALAERGVTARLVHLDDVDDDLDTVDWSGVGLVNVRMCRGYHTDPGFLGRLERLHGRLQSLPQGPVPMANPLPLLRDAVDKGRYLRTLSDVEGIGIIPTRWLPRGTDLSIADLMDDTGWHDLVVKPAVSAGSWRTIRVSRTGTSTTDSHHIVRRGVAVPPYEAQFHDLLSTRDVLVQPFLSSVLTEGELSLVFLGGRFSHAVLKTIGTNGGWWAHERLGGRNYAVEPTAEEFAWGSEVHQALRRHYGPMLFARVDGIRDDTEELRLLECELAIPRLLLPEGRAFHTYAGVIRDTLRHPADAGAPSPPQPPNAR